jgi:undecaprenyl-diphosphatase
MLNHANTTLFLWMTATADPATALLAIARALSFWPLLLALPALRLWAEHRAREIPRLGIAALLAAAAVVLLQHLFASPRPFMLGLGGNLANHAATYGLPSAHATLAATCWMLIARGRLDAVIGVALVAATMWARIYLGAHFPLDVASGALLGAGIGYALRPTDAGRDTASSQT